MNFEEERPADVQSTDTPSGTAEASPIQTEPTTPAAPTAPTEPPRPTKPTKFCSRCGQSIDEKAIICPHCGCQVEQLASATSPNIVINNSNNNANSNQNAMGFDPRALKKEKNKWVALLLCFFLGVLGVHKFYEGKVGMGILYLVTCGLFGIGVFIDFFVILFKPNPYYV